MGRGIGGPIGAVYRRDDGDAKPARRPRIAQQLGRAAPPGAKGAIVADDDVAEADRADQHVVDKRFGTFAGKLAIEMLDEQELDAKPGELALLDAERRQAERLGVRHKDVARMRLEGQ